MVSEVSTLPVEDLWHSGEASSSQGLSQGTLRVEVMEGEGDGVLDQESLQGVTCGAALRVSVDVQIRGVVHGHLEVY